MFTSPRANSISSTQRKEPPGTEKSHFINSPAANGSKYNMLYNSVKPKKQPNPGNDNDKKHVRNQTMQSGTYENSFVNNPGMPNSAKKTNFI